MKELGVTSFDTEHMIKIVENCGIPVVSTQVIDLTVLFLQSFFFSWKIRGVNYEAASLLHWLDITRCSTIVCWFLAKSWMIRQDS